MRHLLDVVMPLVIGAATVGAIGLMICYRHQRSSWWLCDKLRLDLRQSFSSRSFLSSSDFRRARSSSWVLCISTKVANSSRAAAASRPPFSFHDRFGVRHARVRQ